MESSFPGRFEPHKSPRVSKGSPDRRSASGIKLARELETTKEHLIVTADILKVIASSPSDVQPVFEAIVRGAANLLQPCAATITALRDGTSAERIWHD